MGYGSSGQVTPEYVIKIEELRASLAKESILSEMAATHTYSAYRTDFAGRNSWHRNGSQISPPWQQLPRPTDSDSHPFHDG
jgi:hypothetical protein